MPITSSAKKALRSSRRKRLFNTRRKEEMKDVTKNVRRLVSLGKSDDAKKLLSNAYQAIDKAAKRGVIKKNAASRKKSRLARFLKKVQ